MWLVPEKLGEKGEEGSATCVCVCMFVLLLLLLPSLLPPLRGHANTTTADGKRTANKVHTC